ncbi:MAG: hypothetical protein H7301_01110 [Cryobacterium sp.]|nr:hypothetical protein [Oligoflexia bacterium]
MRLLLRLFLMSFLSAAGILSSPTLLHAAPKSLSSLFPMVGNISLDKTKIYPIWSPEYKALIDCQRESNKAAYCPSPNTPAVARFFELSAGHTGIDEPFDFLNRCVGMRGFERYAKDQGPGGVVDLGKMVLTPTGIDCPSLQPNEIVEAHVVACFTRSTGAYCQLASACFEGAEMKGQCGKDYPAETIYISGTGNPPSSSTPTPSPTLSITPPSPTPTSSPFDCSSGNVYTVQGVGGCADPETSYTQTSTPGASQCFCTTVTITSPCFYSSDTQCAPDPAYVPPAAVNCSQYDNHSCDINPAVCFISTNAFGSWYDPTGQGFCKCHDDAGYTLSGCNPAATQTACTQNRCQSI